MKIERNLTFFAGGEQQAVDKTGKLQGQKNQRTIFAGNLKLGNSLEDRIAQRKAEAQKRALKVVGDVWTAEKSIDDDLQSRRNHIDAMEQENLEAQKEINSINDMQESLKETYQVDEDSQEQKDLELLRKVNNAIKGEGHFSKEEFDQAMRIRAEGLTEYQQRQLELDKTKENYQNIIDKNEKNMLEENAIIRGIRQERLKSNPMAEAQKQAEEIKEAASEEIIGMVVEDAKEHIEEEQAEREEQAEKIEEEKEKQEEFIENQKEKKEQQEDYLEDMPSEELLTLEQIKTDVKQEVQNIVSNMKLVVEDIKGAVVDQNV